jgi:hypothetical protein
MLGVSIRPVKPSGRELWCNLAAAPSWRPSGGFGGGVMARFLGWEEVEGRHFDRETIVLCVRCCLRSGLSFRDLAAMVAESGLSIAGTTIMR